MGLRINHNLASLNAALNLGRANSLLTKSLGRLSTGLKINQASDGPADLIISEKMRSQIRALAQATENTESAISMLSTAEGSLTEVNSLLTKIKGLALKAAQSGTQDPDQIAASQAEIDSALQSINSIARNTAFGSKFLLDGSLDIATSEVNTDKINVNIERANFIGNSKRLTMNVIAAAQKAENSFELNSSGQLDTVQTIRVVGNRGSSTITFAAGAAGEDIAKEINDQTTQTGVTATFDSVNKKMVFNSVDYGASEYVTIEDVDGTNDILKGALEEQKTNAYLTYGGQFMIKAKAGGTAGNNISFTFNEVTEGTRYNAAVLCASAAAAIAITQDSSTGGTSVILSLEDMGSDRFGQTTLCARWSEVNKEMDTTLSEIKSLIESNTTLNNLVSFELLTGASLTDKISVDSSITGKALFLQGGASGEAATKASLTLSGSSQLACATANANSITFTAKTAGNGGNDIKILFWCGACGTAATYALNSYGSAYLTSLGEGNSYFSSDGGKSQIFMAANNTLWVNGNATFQQIQQSIEADARAKELVAVSFTGSSNANYVVTTSHQAYNLTGGKGLTGGRYAQTLVDLHTTIAAGLKITAKNAGSDGNGIEVIFRNRGGMRENTVDVFGNKIIVNLDVCAAPCEEGCTRAIFGNLFSTISECNSGIRAQYAGSWANKYDFKVKDDDSLGDNAAVSFDTATNTITITVDRGETRLTTLCAAIRNSTSIIDQETGLTIGSAFVFSSNMAAGCVAVSVVCGAGSAFGGVLNTNIRNGYFSLYYCFLNTNSVVMGRDGMGTSTPSEVIQLIRQNSLANALIDVDFYAGGSSNLGSALRTLCELCTHYSGNNFDGVQEVFGDVRYVLTGGYDGEVTTSSVTKTGVNGQLKVNGVDSSAQNLSFTFDNGDIRGTVTLNESYNTTGNSSVFTITSKGAFFQMGQRAQISYQTGIALKNVSSNALGSGLYLNPDFDTSVDSSSSNLRRVTGSLSDLMSGAKFDLAKSPSTALDIVEAAIKDVSTLRAKIGAFISNNLDSNVNSLGVAFENLTASESRIRDVDFAAETAEFTRAQILVQAGTSVAAQANVATQAALQLLG